jgi:DNA-binding NarL/FixJ family response regulator
MPSEARPGGTIILSQLEKDILKMVVKGMMNKQIAAARGVKEDTIKNEVTAIYNKMGVTRRIELMLKILDTDNRGEHCHFKCVVCRFGKCRKCEVYLEE